MKKWILKAAVQKTISFLPGRHRINFLFQKYLTGGVRWRDELFEDKLSHLQQHLEAFAQHGSGEMKSTLELGTGWYPIVPVGLFLAGSDEVVTVDLTNLMSDQAIRQTINGYQQLIRNGIPEAFQNFWQPERVDALLKIKPEDLQRKELLVALNIEALVGDARQLDYPPGHFDLIHSNNVFEHVDPAVLGGILQKFRKLLRKGGVNCHFIDMSDHFAHLDQSISIYNYLQYSERQWALIDNSVQPQNRWRLPQYRTLYQERGLKIKEEILRPGDPQALAQLRLAKPFRELDAQAVAVSHAYLIS